MKKLWITAIFAMGVLSAHADIYCPQTITCDEQGECQGLGIFTLVKSTGIPKGGIYTFYSASASNFDYSNSCSYYLQNQRNYAISIQSPSYLTADAQPITGWEKDGDKIWLCGTTNTPPNACPFKTN